MKTALLMGLRELARTKARAALLALILALQVSVLGGGFLSVDSVFHTRDVYDAELALADLDVAFTPATPDEMPAREALLAIPGVRAVERRYVARGVAQPKRGGDPLPVIVVYDDVDHAPRVDAIRVIRGADRDPRRPADAVVDRAFAASAGLEPGDDIVVDPTRFATTLHVAGVGVSPEFLIATANEDVLIPAKGSLGVVYASHASLDRLFRDPLYDDLVFAFDPGADRDATQARVLGALGRLDVERVTPKASQFGYRFVEELWGGAKFFSPVAASVLALMALIIALVMVGRVVAQRRREIGALMANGYSARHFVVGLSPLGVVPGLVGAALGVFGAMGYAEMLTRVDCERVGFPPVVIDYAPWTLAWAASSAILVGAIAAIVPLARLARMRPAEAISPARGGEIRGDGVPRVIERVLARVSSPVRFGTRNVFRHRRLSAATLALVALAIAMPAAFLTAISSWTDWVRARTGGLPWDVTASFVVPIDDGAAAGVLADVRGVRAYEGYLQGSAMLARAGATPEMMRVRGVPVPTSLQGVELAEGTGFSAPDADEAILNRGFSRGAPPPRVGEKVTLEYRGKPHTLTVVGIVTDMTLLTVYVPIETSRRILDRPGKTSGVYVVYDPSVAAKGARLATPAREVGVPIADDITSVDVIDDADEPARAPAPAREASATPAAPATPDALRAALLDRELVTSAQTREQSGAALVTFVDSARRNVRSFVGTGVALAFLSLLGILGFLVLERESEYATLRAMGYDARAIATDIATEVALLAAGGLACAVPAWLGLAYVLRALMAHAWFAIPLDFRLADFAGVAAPTLLFLGVVTVPAVRQAMRFDLAGVLRARGIG